MYEKFTYWLEPERFFSLKQELEDQGHTLYETRKTVCLPMAKKIEIGYVAPDTWQNYELCKRQLSWYLVSRYAGKYLLISSRQLDVPDLVPSTVIRKAKFKPPYLPDRKNGQTQGLNDQASYKNAAPEQWGNLDDMDPKHQEKWLKIMGVRGQSYKDLFVTHSANHANFIEPAFFTEGEDGEKIPYSIGKTNQICSACLEMFNIIGAEFKEKMVVPCPGAVLFAGMGVNRYYRVESLSSEISG